MIKKWITVILGVFLVGGFGWLLSQQNPEDAKFANVLRNYLDAYWRFYPTAGTLAGYYRHNDRLEDFEESNVEKYLSGVDKVNAELVNKIAKDKLSPETQVDLDIFRDALDLGMFQLEKIVPQQFNPIMYNDIILESLRGLLTKEFAPLDARLRFATERLKALPSFLKQAKDNLKTPPKEYTEEAIRQFPGILDFYKIEIPKLVENAGPEVKSKFQAEYTKVIPALDDYQKFLQNDLTNRSTGNFRLGQEGHQRLLQLTIGGTLMLNEIGGRAKADTTNLRREMSIICIPYYKIMDPKFDIEHPPSNLTEDGVRNAVISHVLNKIKSAQPTKEEWLAKIKATAEDVKAFIDKTNLLTVPAEMPAIEPMPALGRDVILAKLITPSPYEPSGSYRVRINPYPENLPADQAQSFMDEYTNYMIPIWTIQHVYPGCFVPADAMHLNATLIRKLHPNPALLKGWPLYAQDMFIFAGYNDYDLRQRLMELKLKLQALMDFQIDINVHEGSYTKEQAIRLMTITGFQTQAEAERKWNQIVLHPLSAAYAYIGYQEMLDMEKDYKAAKGDQFSQKEFLNKITSFGPLPLRILKTRILQ